MLAIPNRPATFWAPVMAAVVCASPDIDLAFIHTPLEFLMLHRGLTHSFAFMPFFALILTLLCWPLWRKSTPLAWSFGKVWLFCCAMILLHIWLDVVTTYGTMVFIPFSHYRVRLNSIYMIDVLVMAPLLWAVWRWRAQRKLLLLTLLWTFIYPASGIAINAWHTSQWHRNFVTESRRVENFHILPDFFAPFFWRLLYEEQSNGRTVVASQSLDFLGRPRSPAEIFPAAPAPLVDKFKRESLAGDVYFHFAMLPVAQDLRAEYLPPAYARKSQFLMFYDLRFGSGLEFFRKLLTMRPNAELPFLFMAELSGPENDDILHIRLRFADSGRDSGWHEPQAPVKPTLLQWLAGLR